MNISRENSSNVDDTRDLREAFSRSVVVDYAQVLEFSAAYGVSPHRIRLAKMQEIAHIVPDYRSELPLRPEKQ